MPREQAGQQRTAFYGTVPPPESTASNHRQQIIIHLDPGQTSGAMATGVSLTTMYSRVAFIMRNWQKDKKVML